MLDSLLFFVASFFVFLLLSHMVFWVRCGAWLYQFLIFAFLSTFTWVKQNNTYQLNVLKIRSLFHKIYMYTEKHLKRQISNSHFGSLVFFSSKKQISWVCYITQMALWWNLITHSSTFSDLYQRFLRIIWKVSRQICYVKKVKVWKLI